MISEKLKKYYSYIGNLKIFISFSYKDICQANFLHHILDYYNLRTFFSPVHCEKGKIYPKEILKNLKNSNILLVIVTNNTLQSRWVTKEISTFEFNLKGRRIIPLIFDKVDLSQISPGFNKYEYIDFSDWTNGFTDLLCIFGVAFLTNSSQDLSLERRHLSDRRSDDIRLRLQTSLWNYYSNAYRLSFKDLVKLDERGFYYFCRSILPAVAKYYFLDEFGNLYNYQHVIKLYAEKAWSFFRNHSESKYAKAIELTIYLSDILTSSYNIKWIDRRKDRRTFGTIRYQN